MHISSLEGRAVALWGWGREGRAAYAAIRAQLPAQPLTLLCTDAELAEAAALSDPLLACAAVADAVTLSGFDIIVRSPGISPYGDAARAAAARGTRFVGGSGLWFAGRAVAGGVAAGTVCVTGTKGKSTTTALLAHLLRTGGVRTALCGNIGLPLLALVDAAADAWAIELSSYQTRDVADSDVRPEVAVVTNLFPEHLDWHGSEQRYVDDKLSLITVARPRVAVLNAADPRLAALDTGDSEVRWFNRDDGWHMRGTWLWRGPVNVVDTAAAPLPGAHNRGNLCAVMSALEAMGHDAAALAPSVASFRPLPHRLQALGTRDGVAYVNDSISTTPYAALAALGVHAGARVALLVGGHDRGVDWLDFAQAMRTSAPLALVGIGLHGAAILSAVRDAGPPPNVALMAATDLPHAVSLARDALAGDGVVLLSPGAPSFGAYRDYTERGRHFAALAGADPDAIGAIPGLGIA